MGASDTTEAKRYAVGQEAELCVAVSNAMHAAPVCDIHTHLYSPAFGDLLLWGIDELLTYHYLAAEALRLRPVTPEAYWQLSTTEQADLVWKTLFLERSPCSEACRGVLTSLRMLGLDVGSQNLGEYREYFADVAVADHVDTVFEKARLSSVIMTNDPFDDAERPVWFEDVEGDERFHAALRIDPLLNDWPNAGERLRGWDYDVSLDLNAKTLAEVRRFLEDWLARTRALYLAVSLPPEFMFPEESARATIIAECVLPVAREAGVPFALMIGVTRQVNPALKLAGDGVGTASLDGLHHLCAEYPDNRFMVTMLARENQHALSVAARKFPNLLIFGCWWFLNNPSLIEEMTRMRFELLGLTMIPQHSDARVLDQVLYKWEHSKAILAEVLCDTYLNLLDTGWPVTDKMIAEDVGNLLGGNFQSFIQNG